VVRRGAVELGSSRGGGRPCRGWMWWCGGGEGADDESRWCVARRDRRSTRGGGQRRNGRNPGPAAAGDAVLEVATLQSPGGRVIVHRGGVVSGGRCGPGGRARGTVEVDRPPGGVFPHPHQRHTVAPGVRGEWARRGEAAPGKRTRPAAGSHLHHAQSGFVVPPGCIADIEDRSTRC